MSEIQSLTAPKASFDRRSVVKTAAWSVPVIAAAIAAPAAAASTPTAVKVWAAFVDPTVQAVAGKHAASGKGPSGFVIYTDGTAISGTASVTVTIAPYDKITADSKDNLIMGTIGAGPVTSGSWSGPVSVPAGGVASPKLTIGSYSRTGNNQLATGVTLTYVVTLGITLVDSRTTKSMVLDPIQTFVTVSRA